MLLIAAWHLIYNCCCSIFQGARYNTNISSASMYVHAVVLHVTHYIVRLLTVVVIRWTQYTDGETWDLPADIRFLGINYNDNAS